MPLGAVVRLESSDGEGLGTAFYKPAAAESPARLLSRDPRAEIDGAFLAERLARALAIRERLFEAPYYRLVHAEADGLPGLIVDRFDDALVLQLNCAGMERLTDSLLEALDRLLSPKRILLRNDTPARKMEGLESTVEVRRGAFDAPLELLENGARYLAQPAEGQKTGWFFDQRENRAWIARFAKDARVLDGYSYSGGFTVPSGAGWRPGGPRHRPLGDGAGACQASCRTQRRRPSAAASTRPRSSAGSRVWPATRRASTW